MSDHRPTRPEYDRNHRPAERDATSDRGQLAASVTPYLPDRPPQEPYVPVPSPSPLTGPQIAASAEYLRTKMSYRALAADLQGDTNAVANAAEAAAAKVRGG